MFDKFLTLKNKMKCGTIFYSTMSVSHYHLQIMRKRCSFMFIRVTRKKNKTKFITLWKKRNSISILYYLYYFKILILREG